MLKTVIKEGENIERALKRFKRKYKKTKVLQELRERQQYTKPSQARREIKQKAAYKEKYLRSLEE
ncbi:MULTISPECIES: 30S ribosomal protein S21 [Galbibacter]|uniref:Small ribosomal subunit protein bS21 n=1 Tax=Galbibacter pacificus TaxID=2996052 RepID=A0ABT6FSX3_9FLAO|nr:30S ribosomal protein S21 [Galbibacter pacificus]MDG3582674.1 30S ribosomal protein S21 [Galbibacter pacificus]MDG3586207.1 30S ribosomal protein S21 [Galbibacter pacificus]